MNRQISCRARIASGSVRKMTHTMIWPRCRRSLRVPRPGRPTEHHNPAGGEQPTPSPRSTMR